jgi:hypothetical protein
MHLAQASTLVDCTDRRLGGAHASLTRRPLRPSSTASAAWSARRDDCYSEEAEPPRTLFPEDAWLSSAVSWVTVSSG